MNACPVCGAGLFVGLRSWHLTCETCCYEGSSLHVNILEQVPGGDLDEVAREDALESLRKHNFRRLIKVIERLNRQNACIQTARRLLDVGCAHGWFLEQTRGLYEVTGIEPDREVAKAAICRGLPVRKGFFPDTLKADEFFDVIVFNDVLEHIPNVNATLEACYRHLIPGGLLVINAPSRSGALYRISKILARISRFGTFDRLWQSGFPSPHVHYFDTHSITRLSEKNGFTLLESNRLQSVSISGLYSRVRYSKDVSRIKAAFLTAVVACAIPFLAILPADIEVWFLRRNNDR